MKRILLSLMLLIFLVCGCSSGSAVSATERNSENTITNESFEQFTIETDLTDVSDKRENGDSFDRSILWQEEGKGTLSFEAFQEMETVVRDGIPEDAEYPAVREMPGEWKYDLWILFDPETYDLFEEIGYADFEIDYDRELMIIKLHPRLANDGYEAWEESDEEVGYEPFEGGFEDNYLKLSGNDAIILLSDYFAYEGREYALGEIWLSEEVYGDFWMYRGQE